MYNKAQNRSKQYGIKSRQVKQAMLSRMIYRKKVILNKLNRVLKQNQ